jgi:hypothetical protein
VNCLAAKALVPRYEALSNKRKIAMVASLFLTLILYSHRCTEYISTHAALDQDLAMEGSDQDRG